jgi:hypothetical protein
MNSQFRCVGTTVVTFLGPFWPYLLSVSGTSLLVFLIVYFIRFIYIGALLQEEFSLAYTIPFVINNGVICKRGDVLN